MHKKIAYKMLNFYGFLLPRKKPLVAILSNFCGLISGRYVAEERILDLSETLKSFWRQSSVFALE